MKKSPTSSAKNERKQKRAGAIVKKIARRYGIPPAEAARLILRYGRRATTHNFCEGWWLKLLDAQFMTQIGPYRRIRCGDEKNLSHLIPSPGRLCHDCGCSRGEYHV